MDIFQGVDEVFRTKKMIQNSPAARGMVYGEATFERHLWTHHFQEHVLLESKSINKEHAALPGSTPLYQGATPLYQVVTPLY